MKNIIFVQGIFARKRASKIWKEELKKVFPNDEIFIIDDLYFYTQKEKLDNVINKIENILNNKRETIIFAHSFGGVLTISALLKNPNLQCFVKKMITMATPHSFNFFGIKGIKKYLGYKNNNLKNIDIETYGGYFDCVVPFLFTNLQNKKHKNFFTIHLGFLFNINIISKILNNIKYK